jgi:hypothetical protein
MRLPKKPNTELLNIQLASILSESPYSDRKLCLFFIHDFDYNSNGLRITEELCSATNPKTNKPFYDSLNGAPLVAALKGDDLGGHEPEFDEDGNIIRLNTEGIGTLFNTHIGTYQINNEDIYGVWAEGFLWLRFANTLNVVEELYNENKKVDTSCEVSVGGFEFSEEGRTATKSVLYFGHCLLGSTKRGAYADSGMYEYNLQVAEAYQKDIKNPSEEVEINSNEGGKDVPEKNQIEFNYGKDIINKLENNALSFDDIREQLWSQLNSEKDAEGYTVYKYWIAEVFNEYVVACESESGKYFKFTYSTGESEISLDINSAVEVVSTWIPVNDSTETNSEQLQNEINGLKEQITAKETEINELKIKFETLQGELSQKDEALKLTENDKNEAIIKLNTAMEDLKTQISSLQPIKDKWETDQEQKRIAELNQKKEELKQYIINSKVFTAEEIENENIKQMIEELNESGVKALIADKIVERAKVELNTQTKTDDVNIHINENGKDLIPETIFSKYGIE